MQAIRFGFIQSVKMSLIVIKAGILDTLQDLGRSGYQHLGINPNGGMDKFAMQIANLLAGNDPGEAVLEMHFPVSVFLFTQPALIALSGADFSAHINGEPVPILHSIAVIKNDVLQFHQPEKGARAYLAVSGGFSLDKWMNSYSTNLKAHTGGYAGRALKKDDEVPFRQSLAFPELMKEKDFLVFPWQADIKYLPIQQGIAREGKDDNPDILVLPGNEWERLSAGAKEKFLNSSFSITRQSDRMGYRLDNEQLQSISTEEIISSAVSFGTIQLLPDGGLIILMADHQTTGGYPRIAHVISAHHSILAQKKADDTIRFRLTDQQTAEDLLVKQEQHLGQLQNACTFRLRELIKIKNENN